MRTGIIAIRENQLRSDWVRYLAETREMLRLPSASSYQPGDVTALALREAILDAGNEYVDCKSLQAAIAAFGVHVKFVPPVQGQDLAGLCVTHNGCAAILMPSAHASPSRIACDLAHLAGHLFLGHLDEDEVLADTTINWKDRSRGIERETNEFAIALLTGKPNISLNPTLYRDHMLVDWAKKQSAKHRIAPAIVIQIYARQTGKFSLANRACKVIEGGQ